MTIHCLSALENPRSCCADGKAMLTMVLSNTSINCARLNTLSASHRPEASGLRCAACPCGSVLTDANRQHGSGGSLSFILRVPIWGAGRVDEQNQLAGGAASLAHDVRSGGAGEREGLYGGRCEAPAAIRALICESA